MLISLLILFALLWISLHIYKMYFGGKSMLPHGPTPLPLLGNLHQLDPKRAHKSFLEMSKKYGPIVTIRLGPRLAVVLNDIKTVQECFLKQGENFAGRPRLLVNDEIFSMGRKGIVNSDGDHNKELRRFSLSVLRDFGVGKGRAYELISMEFDALAEKIIEQQQVKPSVDPSLFIKTSVVNVIMRLLFDKTYAFGDPTFKDYQERVNTVVRMTSTTFLFNSYPWLRHFLPAWATGLSTMTQIVKKNLKFVGEQIAEHKVAGIKDVADANDYTSRFLLETKNRSELENNTGPFTDDNLKVAGNEMYIAGFETTVSTLSWALYWLAKHRNIQDRMANEVTGLIGETSNTPTWEQRNSLPYTSAVILETHRIGAVVPLGVFHRPFADTTVFGYTIPADTIVIPNIYGVARDHSLFANPQNFDPTRFLEESGATADEIRLRREAVIPFSIGKRACLGESLARMEVFMFLTGLVSTFRFWFDPAKSQPDPEGQTGFTTAPYPYSLVFEKRSKA
jgi:cytochrome P450